MKKLVKSVVIGAGLLAGASNVMAVIDCPKGYYYGYIGGGAWGCKPYLNTLEIRTLSGTTTTTSEQDSNVNRIVDPTGKTGPGTTTNGSNGSGRR